MQAAYQSSGGGIKGIVAATMTGVQGTFSTAYSAINTLTGGKLESIKLEEDELVGTFISEMALIDEDGDVVAFSNFLAKGKDETEVTFTIEDNY